jgi:hypothetical protein
MWSRLAPPRVAQEWLLDDRASARSVERPPVRFCTSVSAWLLSLARFDRTTPPLLLDANIDVGNLRHGFRFDGTLFVDADYPSLGGRVRLTLAEKQYAFSLPSVQVVPRHDLGLLYVEVRLSLYQRAF